MAKYKERLTAPNKTDKNYIKTSFGGYNYCINIKDGSCLPNCVGYAWGRWRELLGAYHKLSRGNAENWINKNDGYVRGKTPKLGAVICWRKGQAANSNDGCGHVAIVEQIHADGSITCSESSYGGARFNVRKLKGPNYYLGKNYVFQGFIYLPIEFEEDKPVEKPVEKSIDELAHEVLDGKHGNGVERVKSLGDKYDAVQKRVNEILHAKPKEEVLKVGDKVKVLKATQYNGKSFKTYHDKYDVLEVAGDRIVIGVGKTITAAINKKNLKKI